MNYDKILEKFLDAVQQEGTYATREELEAATKPMLDIIQNNPAATPEELVEAVIQDDIRFLEELRNRYPIPGYIVGMQAGNIHVKIFGGMMGATEQKMREDAIFDVASVSKFYTQIIAYNLMKEGAFTLDDKVRDLDSRFRNVGDLTMRDVLTFTAQFGTDGRLDSKRTIQEAKDCLYNMSVVQIGKYNYNDMGMMLTKEVMEHLTGKSYQQLVNYYIVDKLGLKDTHLVLPDNKIERFTGSANATVGMVNDGSALSVGGYSGHAGIKVTSDDLISLGNAVLTGKVFPSTLLSDAYTSGITINPEGGKANRGIMGNTYTSHEKGTDMTYISRIAPKSAFAVQGSTRTQLTIGVGSISTILLNPCSMGLERAREEEAKINAGRDKDHQLSLVRNLTFDRDGKEVHYHVVDARQMVPSGATVERIIDKNAQLSLKLNFLNTVIDAYNAHYKQPIEVVAGAKSFQK